MRVVNVHERALRAAAGDVGRLIDTLSSAVDELWPHQSWPRMRMERPLMIGVGGGHGPVRYRVDAYSPGRHVRFCFTGPSGFDGYHEFEVIEDSPGCILRDTLRMSARGAALVTWPLFFRPLHDALVEDSLMRAQAYVGEPPLLRPWSPYVRLLRWIASRGRASRQVMPSGCGLG